MQRLSGAAAVPTNWDASQIPSLHGKVAIVTGGSSGIGLETALELACKGAHVVIACPAHHRNRAAEERIRAAAAQAARAPLSVNANSNYHQRTHTHGSVEFMKLDLSDLASVKTFARKFLKTHSRLDILVNNAGIMGVSFSLTLDGVERQFATNFLGHFALTHHLLGILQRTDDESRVVHVSSLSHRFVAVDADHAMDTDPSSYVAMAAYAKSKLYCLVFAIELDRRLRAQNITNVISVASHPGYAQTGIMGPPGTSAPSALARVFWSFWSFAPFAQSAAMGALPTLYGATARGVQGGDFFGPSSAFFGMWGHPAREAPAAHALCLKAAARLWRVSEALAQVRFDIQPSNASAAVAGPPQPRAASE